MKNRINLDTLKQITKFVNLAASCPCPVYITDGNGMRVSAKSMLGALYALEFNEIWVESEKDLYHHFSEFIID